METREILAEHSYKELLSLCDWFLLYGPIPIVIGGWAVFIYNSYMGSADIDLVGPSMEGLFNNMLEAFERSQGYEEIKTDLLGMERNLRKPISANGQIVGYIEIDACTYESDILGFHENQEIKLPYALCSNPDLRSLVKLDDDRKVFIPKKPLLFLYKLKAFRDREYDLQTKEAVLGSERRSWLQSKLVKDGSDLIALLDPKPKKYIYFEKFDPELLKQIVETYNLQFAINSLTELPNMEESLDLYPYADREKVTKWIEEIIKII